MNAFHTNAIPKQSGARSKSLIVQAIHDLFPAVALPIPQFNDKADDLHFFRVSGELAIYNVVAISCIGVSEISRRSSAV